MKSDDVDMNVEDNNEPDFDDMDKRLKDIEDETTALKEILGSVAEWRRLNGIEYPAINYRKHSAVLTDFGGIGDGKTSNMKEFQYAVSSLSHYASDGVHNLLCHLVNGSLEALISPAISLSFSKRMLSFLHLRGRDAPDGRFSSLIFGTNLTDVVITGANGTIDGQGSYWWAKFKQNQFKLTRSYLIGIMYSDQIQISWKQILRYKGFYDYAKAKGVNVGPPVGLDVVIDGTVPTGSGLSSSAAFVCSSIIAIMATFDANFPKVKRQIPEVTTVSSRAISSGYQRLQVESVCSRKKVTVVHKANIMKLADGLFLVACREVAQKYPAIQYYEIIVDNCCMQLVLRPEQFDVMAFVDAKKLVNQEKSFACAEIESARAVVL
ncbi:hypothetical protein AHAS_Ahas16G0207700 [Arachis hypogaea]